MQTLSSVNISDRVEGQLPDFIKQEDEQFVNFLFEYYKSQEKTGRPYDLLNNILDYLDIDAYDQKVLASSTTLIKDVDTTNSLIEVESIDGFMDRDGSVMIDNEVIYYENTVRGPDAILTPGLSLEEFNKKRQELESPFLVFDGVTTTFPLKFLGTPVYNQSMIPNVDYTISGTNITFTVAPRERIGTDIVGSCRILYYIGFADSVIKELVFPPVADLSGQDSMTLEYDALPYSPISEIGLIINRNGLLLSA